MANLKKIDTKLIPFNRPLLVMMILNLLTIVAVFLFLRKIPPYAPLFYGLPAGENQLVPSFLLIIPSLISLLIIIINSLITFFLKDNFLKRVLIIGAIGVSIFTLITTFKIIYLIGYF